MRFFARLKASVLRRPAEREIARDVESQLGVIEDEMASRGMAPEEARFAARRAFGGVEQAKEAAWDELTLVWVENLLRDIRHALRGIVRSPGFAAVAIATVALGTGANLAVSTVLYKVVLRPVDYRAPDRLMDVHLVLSEERRGTIPMSWSYPKFRELQDWNRSFEALAAFQPRTLSFGGPDRPERLALEIVSAQYFRTIGVDARLGRVFADEEDRPAGARIALVISDGLWRRRFGADASALGKTLHIQGITMPIVGVMPPEFKGESGRTDAWLPMAAYFAASPNPARNAHNLDVIGRLKPGVTPQHANEEVRMLAARMEREHPTNFGGKWSGGARPLLEARVDPAVRRSLWILQAATACVLLIGCVNLANLLLSRAAARRREAAVRLALGTSRFGLLRQLLVEPVLLALAGGAAGLFLASWGLKLIARIVPGADTDFNFEYVRFIDPASLRMEMPLFALGLLLSLMTGIIFGLLPAWQVARTDVNTGLKAILEQSGRRFRLQNALLVAQMAGAMVLLAGAGLMIRSFAGLLATDFGVETRRIVTMNVQPRTRDGGKRLAFYQELERRAAALPGAAAAAVANGLPVYGPGWGTSLHVEGRAEAIDTGTYEVSPLYFGVYRIPVLAGRIFSAAEGEKAPRVVVLSELAARRFFPGRNPVGRRIEYPHANEVTAEVIGVVGNVKYGPPEAKDSPIVYSSLLQSPRLGYLAVRSAGDPKMLVPALRDIVHALDPEAPVYDVRTVEEQVNLATWRARLAAVLLGAMAAISLALAAVGIYGVFSHAVAARTRDIGVRIALGATREGILSAVMRETALLCGAAVAIGLPCAFALGRGLASVLYRVEPGDPVAYGAAACLLVAVALTAGFLPARRATRIDPIAALRYE